MPKVIGTRLSRNLRPEQAAIPAQVQPRAPFLFASHPRSWEWEEEKGDFVPVLSRFAIDPGVNGVGEDMDPTNLIADAMRRGWVVILPDDPRLPAEYRDYQHEFPHQGNDGKARFVLSSFEAQGVEVIGDQVFIEQDVQAFKKFRDDLVRLQIIPPLPDAIRRVLIEAQREKVQRIQSRVERQPANAVAGAKLERQQQILEAMQATLKGPGTGQKIPGRPLRGGGGSPAPEGGGKAGDGASP